MESTEITTIDTEEKALTQTKTGDQSPFQLLNLAVQNGANADQLGQLMELQSRWEEREDKKELFKRLGQFQADCPPITKNRKVHTRGGDLAYSYANLDDIMKVAKPILGELDLAVSYDTKLVGDSVCVMCHVMYGCAQITSEVIMPTPDGSKMTNSAQNRGIAIQYAKRNATINALNISGVDEDPDGQFVETGEPITEEQAEWISAKLDILGEETRQNLLAWANCKTVEMIPQSKFDLIEANITKKLGTIDANS